MGFLRYVGQGESLLGFWIEWLDLVVIRSPVKHALKQNFFFCLDKLVCLQIQSLYQLARSTANKCFSVAKGHPNTKVTIWFVNHSHRDQRGASLAAFVRAPKCLPLDSVRLWAVETSLPVFVSVEMSKKSHLGQENTPPITVNQHEQIASVEPRAAWPASLLRTCMTCCVLERRLNHRQENKSSKENARCSQSRVFAFPSCTEVDDQRSTAGEEQGCICGKSNAVLGLVPFSLIVICLSNSSSGEGEGRNKTNGYILFS